MHFVYIFSGHIKEDGITVDKFSLRDEHGKMLDIPETKINEMHEIIRKLNLPLGEFQLDAAILTSADQVSTLKYIKLSSSQIFKSLFLPMYKYETDFF